MKKKPLFAIGAAATLLVLSGCSGNGSSSVEIAEDCVPIVEGVSTVSEGELTAAIAEYPPYVSLAGGELQGVDGELIKRISQELCLQPNANTQTTTAIYESVKNGTVDLTSGNHYLNEERQRVYEVSDPVYYDQMVVVSEDGLSSIEELEGLTVGTTQGYLWVGDFQNALGTNNVQLYGSEDATYQDVRNGRIEAGIFTHGAAQQLLESNNDTTLKIEPFEPTGLVEASVDNPTSVVLITKGNTELLEAVNAVLAEMRADGSLAQALEDNGFDPAAADIEVDDAGSAPEENGSEPEETAAEETDDEQ